MIYEFKCTCCGHILEQLTFNQNLRFRKCDQCGGLMEKQISKPAKPIFHGTGFYETDYKGKKNG